MQAAYYEEGKFVPFQPVKIPKGSHAIITILDFSMSETQATDDSNTVEDESRAEWLNRLREARELAMDEHLPEWPFQRSKEMRSPVNLADIMQQVLGVDCLSQKP